MRGLLWLMGCGGGLSVGGCVWIEKILSSGRRGKTDNDAKLLLFFLLYCPPARTMLELLGLHCILLTNSESTQLADRSKKNIERENEACARCRCFFLFSAHRTWLHTTPHNTTQTHMRGHLSGMCRDGGYRSRAPQSTHNTEEPHWLRIGVGRPRWLAAIHG